MNNILFYFNYREALRRSGSRQLSTRSGRFRSQKFPCFNLHVSSFLFCIPFSIFLAFGISSLFYNNHPGIITNNNIHYSIIHVRFSRCKFVWIHGSIHPHLFCIPPHKNRNVELFRSLTFNKITIPT